MTFKEYVDATNRELAEWPGATCSFAKAGKHCAVTLAYGELTRKVFMSSTPSDWRGIRHHVAQLRRELKAMGVIRAARRAGARQVRQRIRPVRFLLTSALADPIPDPFANLRDLVED